MQTQQLPPSGVEQPGGQSTTRILTLTLSIETSPSPFENEPRVVPFGASLSVVRWANTPSPAFRSGYTPSSFAKNCFPPLERPIARKLGVESKAISRIALPPLLLSVGGRNAIDAIFGPALSRVSWVAIDPVSEALTPWSAPCASWLGVERRGRMDTSW
jgi:hypothetical protein